jgi:hypothetical protein|tara:strand:+ start:9401 stop:9907 length:507 start_codon:yes stop_codon:yes gene_type:complete
MSIQDLFEQVGNYPLIIIGFFALPPLLAWLMAQFTIPKEGPLTAWDYGYSVLIYLVGVPGTVAVVLIAYSLFMVRQNLLEVDFLIYFLPVISMVATFLLIARSSDLDRLPGFERLSGLMMLIGLSFLVVLIIFKLRILVGFFASLESLVAIGIVLFILFKVTARKLFR